MAKNEKPKGSVKRLHGNEKTEIVELEKIPELINTVFIEGLPGIGFVGKLSAEYLVEELKAKKVAEVYSHHFPHQVIMENDGTISMLKNDIYIYKDPKKKNDLIILTGTVQPVTSEAQYEVMELLIDFFEGQGGKKIVTLGGYGTGNVSEKPKVFGALIDIKDKMYYKKLGVVFGEAEGTIIGAAGLLLGIGKRRGMKGICLMGETHGQYIDHKSAKRVLEVLADDLDIKLDLKKLDKQSKENADLIKKIEEETKKAEMGGAPTIMTKPVDLSYFR